MTQSSTSSRSGMVPVLALILLLALVAVIVYAKLNGLVDAETAARLMGGLFSLLMIGAGNLLPKRASPDLSLADAALTQKTSRVAGWLLVGGGLASLGLWIWAPADIRIVAATATALSTFAVAILIAAWQLRGGIVTQTRRAARRDHALLHILHGLMWAFAFFLTDVLLGRQVMLWMTLGFTMSMSLLQCILAAFVRRPA